MSLQYIINGRILLPDDTVVGKALAFDPATGKIEGLVDAPPKGADCIDAQGLYVSPGLVDLHIHGYLGADTCDADPEGLRRMARGIVQNGVTSFLPTTMTVSEEEIRASLDAVRGVLEESRTWEGAEILGVHAEGPFINPKKKGAQAEAGIQRPDAEKLRPWADVIRLMTLAPEMDGALECVRAARAMGVTLSMGHTDATYDQAMAGIGAGITHATHTFNAMPPLNHRQPGAVGAALGDARVYCELICDTFHVHPALFNLMAKQAGERLVLITDSIPVAGLPEGPHDQLGATVIVDGMKLRFPDGTIAGSALTLDAAVRNFARHTGLPIWRAVNMASLNPARSIGADGVKGALEAGMDADIVIADGDFNVRATYVRGTRVFASAGASTGQ
ncbi:MAG: N-acetylglucosamine-6-phosphate deacetylase [Clostridia bacterium]|nr:N-acetylglucosamine-6-phosphate deacetylase [Clostridia bacterium]